MSMKALPLRYRGTLFRSRLEADWAASLDKIGVRWDYEPEGFELSDGTCYSPDFWLPGASAWLEVKGSHMLGVSKVERFASDLWHQAGATSTYDANAPMVLLGREPNPAEPYLSIPARYRMTGIMGYGKAYSVTFAQCPSCDTTTAVALWQNYCRSCWIWHDEPMDVWMGTSMDLAFRGFQRVTRPAGRS